MRSKFFRRAEMIFAKHPKYDNVRIATFVTGVDSKAASVCLLDIAPGTEIPAHTHDPQVDSIFVVEGEGEAFINGRWEGISAGDYIFVPSGDEHGVRNTGKSPLLLFVHHSPPLL